MGAVVFFVAVGFGAVRVLLRDAACVRLDVGLGVAFGDGLRLGEADALGDGLAEVGAGVLGTTSTATGSAGGSAEVSCTAPTVPPTASTTPTAAVAAMPAGEENVRVRRCLPATGPVLSSAEQTGPDRNERSTSEVNVIMVLCPHLPGYV
ncbi:hypothetical protein GCM10022379_16930 [Micromonospora maritima]